MTYSLEEDNLLTAARRIVRFIMVDDQSGGGLLSKETLIACNTLARHVEMETRKTKKAPTPRSKEKDTP